MRGRPPKRTLTPEQEQAAAAFVGAAERPGEPPTEPRERLERRVPDRRGTSAGEGRARSDSAATRPWEGEYVRDDVMKGYALRLPEPLYLKLKFVSEETGRSMNGLCQDAIRDAIEAHLRGLP